jgi:hypothetical protein
MKFLEDLLNKGQLPEIKVQVEIDNNSVVRMAVAILAVMLLSILLHLTISKYTK